MSKDLEGAQKLLVALCLMAAGAFAAWGLRSEFMAGWLQYSDVTFHLSLLNQMAEVHATGGSILDFWYDGSPFGYPVFRVYQYFPHLVIFYTSLVSGFSLGLSEALALWTIVLSALLPSSLFLTARLFGFSRCAAVATGIGAVLLAEAEGYGFGLENYTWGTRGLVTQLWALVAVGPASGFLWSAIRTGRGWTWAACAATFAIGCHLVAGYVLALVLLMASMSGIAVSRDIWRERMLRGCVSALGLLVLTAHQWVPILEDRALIHRSVFEPEWKFSGRGIDWTLSQLQEGNLFDDGRLPIVTSLVVVGFAFAVFGRGTPWGGRAAAGSLLLWVSLLCGYEAWGWLFEGTPLLGTMHMHRFVVGVQLWGLLLAGYGAERVLSLSHYSLVRVLLSAALLAAPVLSQLALFEGANERVNQISKQFEADDDVQSLLGALSSRRPGWVYAGSARTWAKQLTVGGYVEVYHPLVAQGVPTMGMLFHSMAKSGDALFAFDPSQKSHYQLFGVHTVVAPSDWSPPSFLTVEERFGRFRVLHYANGSLAACRPLEFSGVQASELYSAPLFPNGLVSCGPDDQATVNDWSSQRIGIRAELEEERLVVLALSYHPRWQAFVDGRRSEIHEVGPGFLALKVPAGSHEVALKYVPTSLRAYLLGLSVGFILVLALVAPRICRKQLRVPRK